MPEVSVFPEGWKEAPKNKDFSALKIVILGVLTMAASGGTGYFFSIFNFYLALLLLLVFVLLFTLQVLFVGNRRIALFLILLEAGALAAPFYELFSAYLILLVVVVAALLFSGTLDSHKELDNSFKIPFFKVSRLALTRSTTAVLLFVSAIYLGLGGRDFLTEKQAKVFIVEMINPVVKNFTPNFSPEMSLEKILIQIVNRNVSPQEEETLKGLPAALQEKFIQDSVGKLASNIEGLSGTKINLKKSLPDVIYGAVKTRIDKLDRDSKIIVGVVVLFILWFLIHSTVAFPLVYLPLSVLGYIIYELLLIAGFAYLQLEQKSKEILVLK